MQKSKYLQRSPREIVCVVVRSTQGLHPDPSLQPEGPGQVISPLSWVLSQAPEWQRQWQITHHSASGAPLCSQEAMLIGVLAAASFTANAMLYSSLHLHQENRKRKFFQRSLIPAGWNWALTLQNTPRKAPLPGAHPLSMVLATMTDCASSWESVSASQGFSPQQFPPSNKPSPAAHMVQTFALAPISRIFKSRLVCFPPTAKWMPWDSAWHAQVQERLIMVLVVKEG